MKKYNKYYKIGYDEGIVCAIKDIRSNKKKRFNYEVVKSKLYDLGYIDGYNRFYSIIKKYLSFDDKL